MHKIPLSPLFPAKDILGILLLIPPQPSEPMKTWVQKVQEKSNIFDSSKDYTGVVILQQHIEATVHLQLQSPSPTKPLAAHCGLVAGVAPH